MTRAVLPSTAVVQPVNNQSRVI